MPKRKAVDLGEETTEASPRRSTRVRTSKKEATAVNGTASSTAHKQDKTSKRSSGRTTGRKATKKKEPAAKVEPQEEEEPESNTDPPTEGQRYWLMKAEPETRLENGHDVRFSIDDLASKSEPEPWDGIRAYSARNNLRAMKKGDLAFFYHSNCKVPAIVGVMEIVKEHSPDFSAQDPKAAYHDPKDTDPSNPKWSVVHVEFRRKFKEPIRLKELREYQETGGPLANMQMLRQSRLSVSAVTKQEWDFLIGVAEAKETESG